MRAREFISEEGMTISVPISITIPDTLLRPEPAPSVAPAAAGVVNATIAAPAGDEMPDQAVFVPPLQQHIELAKQQGGRESPIINQLINQTPEDIAAPNIELEEVGTDDDADQVLELIKRRRERLDQI